MECTSCGADNPAKNRFCGDCGARLERSCPACGESAPDAARVPTLVIAAEHDANQVEHVRYLSEHIEGARFALIRDTSHFATFTAAETYRTIVSTFLATGSLPREEWQP